MFVLYNDVIFDKTAVKKFAFQNDDTWLLPIHHQQFLLLSNSHKQSPVIDIYSYRQAEKSDSLKFISVALRTWRNSIASSRGLVLPPPPQIDARVLKVRLINTLTDSQAVADAM